MEVFGRFRSHGLVGGNMSLGVGFYESGAFPVSSLCVPCLQIDV